MGVCESGAAGSQFVDVRRLRHGMSPKVADPVVLVVDSDKEHIGFLRGVQGSYRKRGSIEKNKNGSHRTMLVAFPEKFKKEVSFFRICNLRQKLHCFVPFIAQVRINPDYQRSLYRHPRIIVGKFRQERLQQHELRLVKWKYT